MSTKAPEHLRFAVIATDTALFTLKNGVLNVRLIRVTRPPHFPNTPGLPGGLIHPEETAEQAAVRHLEEKAGVEEKKTYAEQLYTFSELKRDPRGRVVAVAYLALVPWSELSPTEQADTEHAWWAPVSRATKLAYDHDDILALAEKRLRSRITYTTLIRALLPREFTLPELEQAYTAILGAPVDRRNFRKKLAKLDILEALKKKRAGGRHRPAQLYRFRGTKVTEIEVL